jgi:outer membrane lipoprotein LolB
VPDPNVFRLAGRASVDSEDGDFSGGVQWHHAGAGDEILLLSPLGQAVARIRQDSAGVSLTTASDETFHAPDAETLTQEVLGWRLPLTGLLYWVQGVHAPVSAAEVDSDAQGTVVAIRQDGWEIDYMRYFPAAEAQDGKARLSSARPKLLVLRRPGLRMKLVIDSWDAGER